ncbi:MAG: hypothetical protein J6B94_13475 [Lachnospiraceae bacterium]|nr:hypothetical protein [Lachnospiraceae bacterium]
MNKKIAFLCLNPWETFLPPTFQRCVKDYYQWTRRQALLREESLYCQEKIEVYGEPKISRGKKAFGENEETLQLLYVQSSQKEIIEEVFAMADVVFVGMSGSKKECDRRFLMVLPWQEKTIFLWDGRILDERFLEQIQREYKLRDNQLMEIKQLPSYLTEAVMNQ